MINNKGFTLIEVIIASSILFIIIIIAIPINSLLTSERQILSERFDHTSQLHEELQSYLWQKNKKLPSIYEKTLNNRTVTFLFTKESHNIVKGCVKWTNVREKVEKKCLFGYR